MNVNLSESLTDTDSSEEDKTSSATESESRGVTQADSPPAKDENKPADMADAIRSALQPKGSEEQSSGSQGSKAGADQSAATDKPPTDDKNPAEIPEEELKSYTPNAQHRIRQLVRYTKRLSQESEEYKSQAAEYGRVIEFCNQAGLGREDVNTGFEIMRLMKTDPSRAFEVLTPIYKELSALVGEVLPEEVQERVSKGHISEQDAKELVRLRSERAFLEQRQQREQELADQSQREKEAQTLAGDVGKAVSGWETKWKESDPDYQIKQARVMERIELELMRAEKAGSLPKTAQEAVDLAERIRKEVDTEFKKFIPKKPAVRTVTGVGTLTGSKPAPTSMIEAMKQAVGQ